MTLLPGITPQGRVRIVLLRCSCRQEAETGHAEGLSRWSLCDEHEEQVDALDDQDND